MLKPTLTDIPSVRRPSLTFISRGEAISAENVHVDDRGDVFRLVEEVRGADRAAFAQLFDRFFPVVQRTSLALLRNHDDAQDIANETFLVAWQRIPDYTWTGAPFLAWLIGVTRRLALSHLSKRKRRLTREEGIAAVISTSHPGFADASNQRIDVLQFLSELPQAQREVLALRFYAGMSAAEAATVLDRTATSVRQLQFRALHRLAALAETNLESKQ